MKSNRYVFFKRCYPDYLILITKNKKIKSYNIDREILNYLEIDDINKIDKLNINYLILENVNIVNKKNYKNNKYYLYYKRCKFNILIDKIKDILELY